MVNKTRLEGLIAAPFTPMNDDGSINIERIKTYADHLARFGCINGVFICGSTGEYATTTVAERKAIAEAWMEYAENRFKVIVHVGSNCPQDSIELAAHAQIIGAYAIASIAPNYYKPETVTDLVQFFKPIAAAGDELPFYYYNFPAMSGVRLSAVKFLEEGKKEIPTLTGIKFTHNDFMEMQELIHLNNGEFNILHGFDEVLIAGLACGAKGAVGSTYNYIPSIYRNVMDAMEKGDLASAQKWQMEAVKILDIVIAHGGGTRGGKAIMKLAGVDCGQCRYPITPVSKDEMEQIAKELECTMFYELTK
ncbi:MAG: dihydrodipicolinate synthase family protein [Bacteroidales bacterium]|nr:dihydrodipicolinate synthase family protein [Bacteroidales bacterium]